MSEVIRATAQFQEAGEPMRQKPIIQIDRSLPNTIRASIDSGRDNPFRPDGVIYKSADPIVDYYKYGPNQSRANTPTDGQLLLDKKAAKRRDKLIKKRRKEEAKAAASASGERRKRSCCWWFCCCGCCRKKETKIVIIDVDQQTNQAPVQQQQQQQQQRIEIRVNDGSTVTTRTTSSNNGNTRTITHTNTKTATKDPRKTKIVVLKENDSHSMINGSETRTQSSNSVELQAPKSNPTAKTIETPEGKLTQVKRPAKSSRCVIS